MLPPAASLATPSVPLVQAILTRADLPMDTIALAVCILDSLSSKFARTWRLSCPLATIELGLGHSKRHTLPASPLTISEQLHIDAVCPEVIIMTSLVIAVKFTEDLQQPTNFYSSAWGRGMWSCEQINFTERCIMEALNYRIMPLMDREIISDTLTDMRRAESCFVRAEQQRVDAAGHLRSMSTGVAVVGLGLQLTPAETPGAEYAGSFEPETHAAFHRPAGLSPEFLHLPGGDRGRD